MTQLIAPPRGLSRSRHIYSGLASLAIGLVLVVGVPVLLWRFVGWPLPRTLPAPSSIVDALGRSDVPDTVIIKALALVGWVAWVLMCWTLAAETWAWVRGRPSPNTRFGGPIQRLSRHLITSMSMLVAVMASPAGAHPTLALATTPVVATMPMSNRSAAPAPSVSPPVVADVPSAEPPAAASPSTIPITPTYTVQRHDSLWAIAESQLGDPLRWRELWLLNCNRDFGGVTFDDPNVIYSGWNLNLPESAIPAPPPAAYESPAPPPTETAPVDPPPPDPPVPEQSTTTTAPTAVAPAPTAASTAPAPLVAPARPADPSGAETADEGGMSLLAVFAGGSILATALLALLTRLRRSQQRRRRPGRPPHLPPAETSALETALRRSADTAQTDRLSTTLRAFAAGSDGDVVPELAAVRVGEGEIELLLGQPIDATPPGFEDRGERRAFASLESVDQATLAGLAGETPAPWPAVVSVGQLGDDEVLVDLETAGVLTVDGDQARDTIRRMVAELAASPISDLIDIVVVGNEIELPASDRIRSVDSIESALDMLELARNATSDSLALVGDSDTATARRSHSAEHGWGVTLMASLDELTVEQGQRLTSFAQGRHGMAALVVGAPLGCGSWSLTLGEKARLEPHHFELDPLPLEEAELDQVNALLDDAAMGDADIGLADLDRVDRSGSADPAAPPERRAGEPAEALTVPTEHPITSSVGTDVYVRSTEPSLPAEEGFDVEVRVLGRVEIQGAETIARPRSVELTAYLALHPEGVSAVRLKTAIWPESDLAQGTFNTTVYRARVGLGVDRSGQQHLPHAVNIGNCYSLGPWVTTDLARFVDMVNRSQGTDHHEEEVALLRSALELVRGQPFEEVGSGYEWAFTEGIITEAEATIADAAHRLAQLLLQVGDHAGATWAAQRGLNSVPGSEPLYRDRMEAAHLAGDPAAVDRIVEELCHYVETLDPFDDLHPETIELWRRIGRPRSRA